MGDSQGEQEPHLGKGGGINVEHGEERVDFTVKEGRIQAGEGGQTKNVSLGEVESMNG